MTSTLSFYAKKRVAINTVTWTPIVAPINSSHFDLKNLDGTALLLRTDVNDPESEDELPPGFQEIVNAVPTMRIPRWGINQTVLWVKAVSGVGPVMVTWVA